MHAFSPIRIFLFAFGIVLIFAIVSFSGTAGRLFGFQDTVGAWVMLSMALTLVIASGVLASKVSKRFLNKWAGLIGYLAFVVGVGAFSGYKAYTSTPEYMMENVAIKVTVHDVAGTTGDIDTQIRLKILKDNDGGIRWGGPSSTGVIKNFRVNESKDFTSEIMNEAGEWQFQMNFPKPLRKGDHVNFGYGFDIVDSVPEPTTEWVADITTSIQNLEISLVVPKERPCKSVRAQSHKLDQINVDVKEEEHQPLLANDNSEVKWDKANPQVGRTYVVTCYH